MKAKTKSAALATGAGVLTAAALAAAGAYLLSTDEGKKKTKQAKAWVAKAKKHIALNLQRAKSMHEGQYKELVETAVKRYGKLEDADVTEIMRVAKEMKGDWAKLKTHAQKMASVMHVKKAPAKKKKTAPKAKTSARKSRTRKSAKASKK